MKLTDLFEPNDIIVQSYQLKEAKGIGTITWSQLKRIEDHTNQLWNTIGFKLDIPVHFFKKINVARNTPNITVKELRDLFDKSSRQLGNKLSEFADKSIRKEAVIFDSETNINVPVAIKWNNTLDMFELIAKTVKRKKDYHTSNTKFVV
jgi:hypothetical protein